MPESGWNTQIVCSLFYVRGRFSRALGELHWSIRQNPEFWREAVLYCDPDAARHLRSAGAAFREVVIDRDLPDHVDKHRMWCCKGWWAQKAAKRFGRILFCDFDILVLRPPDVHLQRSLETAPLFLEMPGYTNPRKALGCGVSFYDDSMTWALFLDNLYNRWHCDERAWTDTLGMTKEKLVDSGLTMTPEIVDFTWLRRNPERRQEVYLVHGISDVDEGLAKMQSIGFARDELDFRQRSFLAWRKRLNQLLLR